MGASDNNRRAKFCRLTAAGRKWLAQEAGYWGYSAAVLLLMIPTVTETLTRVPPSAPWVASPEAPVFPPLYSVLLALFLVGVSLQVRRLHVQGHE